MANIKVKLLEAHFDRDSRYIPAGSVVDWDENLINENQIPAPGLGTATTTAQNKFASVFDAKAAPISGQPGRFKRKNV